jgi:hypothetical protein
MKNIKKFYIKNLVVVLSLVLVFASCDGWIDRDLNIDPVLEPIIYGCNNLMVQTVNHLLKHGIN